MRRAVPIQPEFNTVADDIVYQSVTVTLGKELFCPVQYYSFEVGPYSLTTQIREGETVEEACARARKRLEVVQAEDFELKVRGHLERIRAASAITRELKGK